jgi:hypothetical protein
VVCPPVYTAGLAIFPCGVTSADETPVYAAGLAISKFGAEWRAEWSASDHTSLRVILRDTRMRAKLITRGRRA